MTSVSATGPLVIHILEPLSTYRSPFLSARARIDTTSEPAPGSDIARAPTCWPEISFGRYLRFCCSLPLRRIWLTQRLEWAPYDKPTAALAREISSIATQCSRYPRPEPPYSSSTVMPCRPSAPISGHRSRGKTLSRSIASARGAMRSCAKSFTLFRSMSTSVPSPKSKPTHALGIMRRLRWRARSGAACNFISCSSRCQRLARWRSGHAVLPRLFQEGIDCARRRWLGKEESLHLIAAGKPQQDPLVLGFDSLNEHRQAERAAERHHRLDDHAAV